MPRGRIETIDPPGHAAHGRPSERHRGHRAGWLRAAVLGADDGIVSTASLMLGVAAAQASRSAILIAGLAGLFAGAMAMATGEFVSVSSQRDTERADLTSERWELANRPQGELDELVSIYVKRGVEPALATAVAAQLTRHDALGAHARDELGFAEASAARPVQAAGASAASFAGGSAVPLLALLAAPAEVRAIVIVVTALIALGTLGAIGARVGGAPWRRAVVRVVVGGGLAMAVTALVGRLVGSV